MMDVFKIDSIDAYNRLVGLPTRHSFVAVVDLKEAANPIPPGRFDYDVYALFLKKGSQCSIRYGCRSYDFQRGSVVSFSPGQVVEVTGVSMDIRPDVVGLLFHPDIAFGTSLGNKLSDYSFFGYADNEAVHLSDDEHDIFIDCLDKIKRELEHPIDRHSGRLLSAGIDLLLEYMTRFYDRQFITRSKVNSEIVVRFEKNLKNYYRNQDGNEIPYPTVSFFADKANLSAGYFGDLVKKHTGISAQEIITRHIVDEGKRMLLSSSDDINTIAYGLGFQYPQHFTRLFKRLTGQNPTQYRRMSLS